MLCARLPAPAFPPEDREKAGGGVSSGSAAAGPLKLKGFHARCAAWLCLSALPAAGQDSAMTVDASLFGQEVTIEEDSLSLEPISDDPAGYSDTAAEELTEGSAEKLNKIVPKSLSFRVALGGL